MAARIEPLMTVEDLEAMPEDGNRYEVIEGELFVSCAPGLPHQLIATNIVLLLGNYLKENPIGVVVPTPGLILERYSGVIPDIVFFSHERGAEIIANERLQAAPELVIEILSPGRENLARDRVANASCTASMASKNTGLLILKTARLRSTGCARQCSTWLQSREVMTRSLHRCFRISPALPQASLVFSKHYLLIRVRRLKQVGNCCDYYYRQWFEIQLLDEKRDSIDACKSI